MSLDVGLLTNFYAQIQYFTVMAAKAAIHDSLV